MNTIILLTLIATTAILIGSYFGVRKGESLIPKQTRPTSSEEELDGGQARKKCGIDAECLISEQSQQKQNNKDKILVFLESNKKITNNDVEKLCKVSNATAERYLDELEKDGKIKQIGTEGRSVHYLLV